MLRTCPDEVSVTPSAVLRRVIGVLSIPPIYPTFVTAYASAAAIPTSIRKFMSKPVPVLGVPVCELGAVKYGLALVLEVGDTPTLGLMLGLDSPDALTLCSFLLVLVCVVLGL